MLTETAVIALAALAAVIVVALTALRGWQGWLALRTRELDLAPREIEGGAGAARIEIADLKERIRRLEAIAAGVDL